MSAPFQESLRKFALEKMKEIEKEEIENKKSLVSASLPKQTSKGKIKLIRTLPRQSKPTKSDSETEDATHLTKIEENPPKQSQADKKRDEGEVEGTNPKRRQEGKDARNKDKSMRSTESSLGGEENQKNSDSDSDETKTLKFRGQELMRRLMAESSASSADSAQDDKENTNDLKTGNTAMEDVEKDSIYGSSSSSSEEEEDMKQKELEMKKRLEEKLHQCLALAISKQKKKKSSKHSSKDKHKKKSKKHSKDRDKGKHKSVKHGSSRKHDSSSKHGDGSKHDDSYKPEGSSKSGDSGRQNSKGSGRKESNLNNRESELLRASDDKLEIGEESISKEGTKSFSKHKKDSKHKSNSRKSHSVKDSSSRKLEGEKIDPTASKQDRNSFAKSRNYSSTFPGRDYMSKRSWRNERGSAAGRETDVYSRDRILGVDYDKDSNSRKSVNRPMIRVEATAFYEDGEEEEEEEMIDSESESLPVSEPTFTEFELTKNENRLKEGHAVTENPKKNVNKPELEIEPRTFKGVCESSNVGSESGEDYKKQEIPEFLNREEKTEKNIYEEEGEGEQDLSAIIPDPVEESLESEMLEKGIVTPVNKKIDNERKSLIAKRIKNLIKLQGLDKSKTKSTALKTCNYQSAVYSKASGSIDTKLKSSSGVTGESSDLPEDRKGEKSVGAQEEALKEGDNATENLINFPLISLSPTDTRSKSDETENTLNLSEHQKPQKSPSLRKKVAEKENVKLGTSPPGEINVQVSEKQRHILDEKKLEKKKFKKDKLSKLNFSDGDKFDNKERNAHRNTEMAKVTYVENCSMRICGKQRNMSADKKPKRDEVSKIKMIQREKLGDIEDKHERQKETVKDIRKNKKPKSSNLSAVKDFEILASSPQFHLIKSNVSAASNTQNGPEIKTGTTSTSHDEIAKATTSQDRAKISLFTKSKDEKWKYPEKSRKTKEELLGQAEGAVELQKKMINLKNSQEEIALQKHEKKNEIVERTEKTKPLVDAKDEKSNMNNKHLSPAEVEATKNQLASVIEEKKELVIGEEAKVLVEQKKKIISLKKYQEEKISSGQAFLGGIGKARILALGTKIVNREDVFENPQPSKPVSKIISLKPIKFDPVTQEKEQIAQGDVEKPKSIKINILTKQFPQLERNSESDISLSGSEAIEEIERVVDQGVKPWRIVPEEGELTDSLSDISSGEENDEDKKIPEGEEDVAPTVLEERKKKRSKKHKKERKRKYKNVEGEEGEIVEKKKKRHKKKEKEEGTEHEEKDEDTLDTAEISKDDGVILDEESKIEKKKNEKNAKVKSKEEKRSKKRSGRSKSKEKHSKNYHSSSRSRSRSNSRRRSKDRRSDRRSRSRSGDRERNRNFSRDRFNERGYADSRWSRSFRGRSPIKAFGSYYADRRRRSRSRSRSHDRSKDRSSDRNRRRSRSGSKDRKRRSFTPVHEIDKKKLLEIAKANAFMYQKVQSDDVPATTKLIQEGPEKVAAVVGGKTVQELTEVCKKLQKEPGEESSSDESMHQPGTDDDEKEENFIRHPFQVRERASAIVVNIQNSIPLPVQKSKEVLRVQFPVSSGAQHRKKEVEISPFGNWQPVQAQPAGPFKSTLTSSSIPSGTSGTANTQSAIVSTTGGTLCVPSSNPVGSTPMMALSVPSSNPVGSTPMMATSNPVVPETSMVPATSNQTASVPAPVSQTLTMPSTPAAAAEMVAKSMIALNTSQAYNNPSQPHTNLGIQVSSQPGSSGTSAASSFGHPGVQGFGGQGVYGFGNSAAQTFGNPAQALSKHIPSSTASVSFTSQGYPQELHSGSLSSTTSGGVVPQGFGVQSPANSESQGIAKEDRVFEDAPDGPVDIASVVSARIKAARLLQTNPQDADALSTMHQSQQRLLSWAQNTKKPGLFTGTTDATILTPEQLSNPNPRHQAWTKKDMFKNQKKVSGGIGMHLLQKMGWREGEGLGKNSEGSLEPLRLEVKTDRKGLEASSETALKKFQKMQRTTLCRVGKANMPKMSIPGGLKMDLTDKHPVSLLNEICSKRRWKQPEYTVVHDFGPPHKKEYIIKVKLQDQEYQPATATNNKKEARAMAAKIVLESMGMLPRTGL